ncbi:hypothetical protein C8R43DRAFT_953393 [Mycena crocata]|nr:hypothetical protein C8R43DRAFT_953393 [Mycena crocata]
MCFDALCSCSALARGDQIIPIRRRLFKLTAWAAPKCVEAQVEVAGVGVIAVDIRLTSLHHSKYGDVLGPTAPPGLAKKGSSKIKKRKSTKPVPSGGCITDFFSKETPTLESEPEPILRSQSVIGVSKKLESMGLKKVKTKVKDCTEKDIDHSLYLWPSHLFPVLDDPALSEAEAFAKMDLKLVGIEHDPCDIIMDLKGCYLKVLPFLECYKRLRRLVVRYNRLSVRSYREIDGADCMQDAPWVFDLGEVAGAVLLFGHMGPTIVGDGWQDLYDNEAQKATTRQMQEWYFRQKSAAVFAPMQVRAASNTALHAIQAKVIKAIAKAEKARAKKANQKKAAAQASLQASTSASTSQLQNNMDIDDDDAIFGELPMLTETEDGSDGEEVRDMAADLEEEVEEEVIVEEVAFIDPAEETEVDETEEGRMGMDDPAVWEDRPLTLIKDSQRRRIETRLVKSEDGPAWTFVDSIRMKRTMEYLKTSTCLYTIGPLDFCGHAKSIATYGWLLVDSTLSLASPTQRRAAAMGMEGVDVDWNMAGWDSEAVEEGYGNGEAAEGKGSQVVEGAWAATAYRRMRCPEVRRQKALQKIERIKRAEAAALKKKGKGKKRKAWSWLNGVQ